MTYGASYVQSHNAFNITAEVLAQKPGIFIFNESHSPQLLVYSTLAHISALDECLLAERDRTSVAPYADLRQTILYTHAW